MKKKKKTWIWVAIYLIAIAVCIVLIYIVPSVMGLFDTTYVAKHGSIEVDNNVEAYIIRDDTVYVAGGSGDIKRVAEEGRLVKGQSQVVELSGNPGKAFSDKYTEVIASLRESIKTTNDGVTARSGYVSYFVDGKEEVFSPANLDKLSKEKVESYNNFKMVETPEVRCAEGEPLFKVSANDDWYLLFWINNDYASRFQEGRGVTVVIDSQEITGTISKVAADENMTRIEISSNRFIKELLSKRNTSARVITHQATGIIIESGSIIEKNGVKGVIVRDKIGDGYFKPISVMADNGTQAAIRSDYFMNDDMEFVETVKAYDEVVRSPSEEEIASAEDINDKYKQ